MSRYWILDREDTPQGFPLALLVARIREFACNGNCQFFIQRSQGYGAQVCRWDETLNQTDEITVSADELVRISRGVEEWFYNLEAKCITPTETIGFGLHDSSALFLDAPFAIAEKITATFKKVRAA